MKCHQRIIREQEASDIPTITLSKESASIRPITREEAKPFILRYEWLGTMPAVMTLAVGLYFGELLAGVECFTRSKPGSRYSLNGEPAICLSRGACAPYAPIWAGSYLVRKALDFLPEDLAYVLCYADTDAGEYGKIYQAANFYCIGTVDNIYWRSPQGKRYDRSHHRDKARSCVNGVVGVRDNMHLVIKERMLKDGWELVKGGTRYRYAAPLGRGKVYRQRMDCLEKMKVDYPMRPKSQ